MSEIDVKNPIKKLKRDMKWGYHGLSKFVTISKKKANFSLLLIFLLFNYYIFCLLRGRGIQIRKRRTAFEENSKQEKPFTRFRFQTV